MAATATLANIDGLSPSNIAHLLRQIAYAPDSALRHDTMLTTLDGRRIDLFRFLLEYVRHWIRRRRRYATARMRADARGAADGAGGGDEADGAADEVDEVVRWRG